MGGKEVSVLVVDLEVVEAPAGRTGQIDHGDAFEGCSGLQLSGTRSASC